MSAEFEKIVLEKFDELNSKIDANTKSIDKLSKELHKTQENVNALSEKVENNTTLINNLSEKVENNITLINNLSEKVENNTTLINNLSEKVENQGLNFARFESEFNVKIQGLFDSFVSNTESHLAYDKFICSLNAKTYNQDLRISVLEDHLKDTKLLATS